MRYLSLLLLLFLTSCTREPTEQEVLARQQTLNVTTATTTSVKQVSEADRLAEAKALVQEEAKKLADTRQAMETKARDQAIGTAAANLAPIATVVTIKGQPDLASAITAQKTTIDTALNLPPDQQPKATITTEGLLKDALAEIEKGKQAAAGLQASLDQAKAEAVRAKEAQAKADAEAARAQQEAKDAQAKALASALALDASVVAEKKAKEEADAAASEARWMKIAGGVGTGLLALITAAANGAIPGLGQIGGLGKLIAPAICRAKAAVSDELDVAKAACAAGDVGRSALSRMEAMLRTQKPELHDQLSGFVQAATSGRASGIESLFKMAAQAHVLDQGAGVARDVQDMLTHVRDEHIDTKGGMPTILDHILS